MGIQDRDYWREKYLKNDYRYNPKPFRSTAGAGHGSPTDYTPKSWPKLGVWAKAIVMFLAVYGALNMVKGYIQKHRQFQQGQQVQISAQQPTAHRIRSCVTSTTLCACFDAGGQRIPLDDAICRAFSRSLPDTR